MFSLLSTIIGILFIIPTGGHNFYNGAEILEGNTGQAAVSIPQATLAGDETERFEQTYPLNPNGKVSVDNVNGSIIVEAWDRNEVKFEAVKIADSRERLKEVEIKIEAKPEFFRVETEYGTWKNGNRSWNCSGYCRLEVQYKLMVPRGAYLSNIETVNGSVTISNMTNYTNASAVNGSVKATNLRGTTKIETVNGASDVSFERLNDDSKINLSTVNGRVNLIIPSDADATIKADTVNGSISNEFNMPVRKGKYVGRDLYAKLGEGRVKINLDSVNGGLSIKRLQDGKSPKNVTNLLNMKDSDIDSEIEAAIRKDLNKGKLEEEIAKSVKESAEAIAVEAPKVAAAALADVKVAVDINQKALEKISQRELMRTTREAMRINKELMKANWADASSSRIEENSETFPVRGIPRVIVEAKKCSVVVKGWDKSEVKYRLVKLVRGEIHPEVSFNVLKSDTEVTLNANVKGYKLKPSGSERSGEPTPPGVAGHLDLPDENAVRLEVYVPKKSNLRILSDQEIRIEGVVGNIDLTGSAENINIRDSQGKLNIKAREALIRVIGFSGELYSKTSGGTNFFEGNFEKLSAQAIDGRIILTLPDFTNADIQADTEIQTSGFDLDESAENEDRRRLGEGGKLFDLKVADGEIFVRNLKLLNTKY